ncbi:response regulator [Opitutus terrae]|uniref:Two component transcriptional regulator, LuxR family n=1 Tax=Opitutus terrae (strain DSM 11246 / JCM 15787 / PB90-1) TaxID=452637 RepID=B1ZU87_OPITP|nr:response regulator transcription factor [Opitutus terrae]ACB76649.1 two component transcriptional regulator, LuxR family [Opitutus terrae PB90-1]
MHKTVRSDKIRILLVDDHMVMRMGLVTATSDEPDMEVVADVENGAEAIEAYRAHRPDVVVLDLRMHGMSGVDAIRALRSEFGNVRVLVYSNYAAGEEVYQALKAGASGFVVKEMALERLLEAIRKVHAGEQYVPPEIAMRMGERLMAQLSPRELDVLKLVAKGRSNKEIAAELHVVEGTAKIHVANILTKLGVSDRTQAIVVAVRRGIIQIE